MAVSCVLSYLNPLAYLGLDPSEKILAEPRWVVYGKEIRIIQDKDNLDYLVINQLNGEKLKQGMIDKNEKTAEEVVNHLKNSIPKLDKNNNVNFILKNKLNCETNIKVSNLTNQFLELINNAKENISFWGYRYITVPGLKGRASIDALAAQVIKLVRGHKFEYTKEERNIGILMSRKIEQLYDASDVRLKKSNFLTRFFRGIRLLIESFRRPHFFMCPAPEDTMIHWEWRDCFGLEFRYVFEFYTRDQYKKDFKTYPNIKTGRARSKRYDEYELFKFIR